jgi:hypothetical protein
MKNVQNAEKYCVKVNPHLKILKLYKMKAKKPQLFISNNKINCSWDTWLEETETKLKELGFHKYCQNHKREDFAYWKPYTVDSIKLYQIGLLFYDFRKYAMTDLNANRISIQFECMILNMDARIDLEVSKDISLEEFEKMSKTFYESMSQYCQK